jgi:sarcosine oxidase subunit alpha
VNCWPSARFDIGALAGLAAPLLPAGFYYKTFMAPDWHLFEPSIRRAAGLGRAPQRVPDDDAYESRFGHCDVLVVGGGGAGLAAALAAARSGARVFIADDGFSFGGRLTADGRRLDDAPAEAWIARALAELRARDHVRVFADATVWGHLEHNLVAMVERNPQVPGLAARNWKIRARQVVIATGAFERPIAFAGSDRPGVMLASASRTYLHKYSVVAGHNIVVFTNNDSAYDAAHDLARAGARVAIVDCRHAPPEKLRRRSLDLGCQTHAGALLRTAHGHDAVHAVTVCIGDASALYELPCDLVVTSGGWNPAMHLASQAREARAMWSDKLATFVPEVNSRRLRIVGAAAGTFGLAAAMAEGARAGAAAARDCGFIGDDDAVTLPHVDSESGHDVEALWHVPPLKRRAKVFLDLVNDVTTSDIALARREGYEHVEHVKRYTTAGMGVDQGKTVNVSVIATLAAMQGTTPDRIGTTTFRQPFVPVEFGPIAGHRSGHRLLPMRRSPIWPWHVEAGAVMFESGLRWQRPGYYPCPGEDIVAATQREARAVREAAGVYDGSSLGKFLIKGPDAVALLDLLYVNDWASLKPGRGRYGVMLYEDGLFLDDGVTFRLDEHHYLLMSSTGGADRVYGWIEELLQLHRPDLRVTVTPVTSHWANITLCGPRARDVLLRAGADFDISRDALPFMAMRDGRVAGLPARVMRVSWTGEMSFEINTPARHARTMWQAILESGREFGIAPIGSEANHVLRVEAGYISSGHEVDGPVDLHDLGLGWMISRTKRDFIGKRAMEIRRAARPQRRELVGFLPEDSQRLVPEGAPITQGGQRTDSEGFVSACVRSVVLNRVIALGLLTDGRARIGTTVHAKLPDAVIPMCVVEPVFHDRDRARVKG